MGMLVAVNASFCTLLAPDRAVGRSCGGASVPTSSENLPVLKVHPLLIEAGVGIGIGIRIVLNQRLDEVPPHRLPEPGSQAPASSTFETPGLPDSLCGAKMTPQWILATPSISWKRSAS